MGTAGASIVQALIKVIVAHPELLESILESGVQLLEAELKKAVQAKQVAPIS